MPSLYFVSKTNFPVMVVVELCKVDVVRKRHFARKISCLRIYLWIIFHLLWPEHVFVFRYIQTIHNILLCLSQKYAKNITYNETHYYFVHRKQCRFNIYSTRNCYKVGYNVQHFRRYVAICILFAVVFCTDVF